MEERCIIATTLPLEVFTKKLCSKLFSTEVEFFCKKAKSRFVPLYLGELLVTYTVHLWLVGMRVVNFLLLLTELELQQCCLDIVAGVDWA